MNYDTTNLDEAAYLALQGFPFTITRTAPVSAIFSFTVDGAFDEIRARFWRGEVSVQLHHWLATRTGLKNAVKGQPTTIKQVVSPSIVPAQQNEPIEKWQGFPYWFKEDNCVKCEKFGNRPLHIDRFNKGNAYRSKGDALANRNPIAPLNPNSTAAAVTQPTEKEKAGGAWRSPA